MQGESNPYEQKFEESRQHWPEKSISNWCYENRLASVQHDDPQTRQARQRLQYVSELKSQVGHLMLNI